MTRPKEIKKPLRIDFMIGEDTLDRLDKLSKDTSVSRSRLIRVACDLFLEIIGGKSTEGDIDEIKEIILNFYKKEEGEIEEEALTDMALMLDYNIKKGLIRGMMKRMEPFGLGILVNKIKPSQFERIKFREAKRVLKEYDRDVMKDIIVDLLNDKTIKKKIREIK